MSIKAKLIALATAAGAVIAAFLGLIIKNKVVISKMEKEHKQEVKKIYESEKERREIKETMGKGDTSKRVDATSDVVRKLAERTKA